MSFEKYNFNSNINIKDISIIKEQKSKIIENTTKTNNNNNKRINTSNKGSINNNNSINE